METEAVLKRLQDNEEKRKTRNSTYLPSTGKAALKLRSKSVSSVEATKPQPNSGLTKFPSVPAFFARDSVEPKTSDSDLTLLEGNKEFANLNYQVICHRTLDHRANQEIASGFNYLVIDESLFKSLERKAEGRDVSNPLKLAAMAFLNILWHQHLRPACQKLQLKSDSPQIDLIIKAALNEFSASNIEENRNEMLMESSDKLDSNKLFDYFKNDINKNEYKEELRKLRTLIKQARNKRLATERKNQATKGIEIKIEELKVPKKGKFISQSSFTKEFAMQLGLEEKDLKEIPSIIFESIRTTDTLGENSLLISSLKSNDPIYFKTESLLSLFAKIKIEFKKLLKVYVNNERLIKDINEIKDKEIIKNSVVKAINTWFKEESQNPKNVVGSDTSEIILSSR